MTQQPPEMTPSEAPPKVDLALCVDPFSLRRFRAVLRHLCVGLLDAAAKVRLVTSSPEVDTLILGSVLHVRYREYPWPFRQRAVRRLLDAFADHPPNIIHGFSARSFETAAAIAHHLDAHLVLHALGLDDAETLAASDPQAVGRVVAASTPIHDAIVESESVVRDRLTLIRPGIMGGDGPTCFATPHRVPTVLCTSRLTAANGVDRLLDALRMMRDHGREFMAFLTGTGPMEGALRAMTRASGLAPVVTFAEPAGDARQIMAGADIFVRPAVERALSVRTLQAMGSGMAVVTVRGGAADSYVDRETALVCADGRATTLAAGMERLLDNHAFARELAARAVRHVKQNHSVSAMCDAQIQVYSDLVLRDRTLAVGESVPKRISPS